MPIKKSYATKIEKSVFSSCIVGNEGTLKTGTMLETDDPTLFITTDLGFTAPLNRAIGLGRKIHVEKIVAPQMEKLDASMREQVAKKKGPLEYDSDTAIALWRKFRGLVQDFLHDRDFKSLVIDTGSDLQDIQRMAWFGKLTQVMPTHYSKPNREFDELFESLVFENGCPKNVHVLHHMKKQYVRSKGRDGQEESAWNGKWEMKGHDPLRKAFDVVVFCEKGPVVGEGSGRQVTWTISKARDNRSVEGMELNLLDEDGDLSGEISYDYLKAQVLP